MHAGQARSLAHRGGAVLAGLLELVDKLVDDVEGPLPRDDQLRPAVLGGRLGGGESEGEEGGRGREEGCWWVGDGLIIEMNG